MVGIFSKKSKGINAYERTEVRRTTYLKRMRMEQFICIGSIFTKYAHIQSYSLIHEC